jgi:endonuclease YncB( thermonuclease family)
MAEWAHRLSRSSAALSTLTLLLLAQAIQAAEAKTNAAASKWVALNGCRFVPENHRDGDSFHIKYGQREFIIRLYFVDSPETDESVPDRNKEQCKYFQVTPGELRKAGEAARDATAELLKKPFVVTTRWQNAMGRSSLPRYFAMVEVEGQDLAEILVSRGLARAKGTVAIPPSGGRARDRMDRLRKLEAEAKARRVGVWATSRAP